MGEVISYTKEGIEEFVLSAAIIGTDLVLTKGNGTTITLAVGGATQADIDAAIAALIGDAPGTLDTINELAAALADNPNVLLTKADEVDNADGRFIPLKDTDGLVKGHVGWSAASGGLVLILGSDPLAGSDHFIVVGDTGITILSSQDVTLDTNTDVVLDFNGDFNLNPGVNSVIRFHLGAVGVQPDTETPSDAKELADILEALGLIGTHTLVADSVVETNNQTGTTYSLVLTDAGKVVELNNAAAIIVTIPTNAAVAFPIGTVIELWQQGAGQVSVAAAVGVTIRSSGGFLKLYGQYASASLRKRATDEWVLIGDLVA